MVYDNETADIIRDELAKMPGTVAAKALEHAAHNFHPLLTAMDALLRAAKDYSRRFDGAKLVDDYVLGPPWVEAAKGVRRLLDGDFGPIDNGTVEKLFWRALDAAGYDERSANL